MLRYRAHGTARNAGSAGSARIAGSTWGNFSHIWCGHIMPCVDCLTFNMCCLWLLFGLGDSFIAKTRPALAPSERGLLPGRIFL